MCVGSFLTVVKVRSQLPLVRAIVQWSGEVPKQDGVYSWDEFIKLGATVTTEAVNERIDAQKPEQCATLIYTSGTTGQPKAVMLSHDNLTWTAQALVICLKGSEEVEDCGIR